MTYTDIGGGGDLKPHGEDYFNRIVNVHWPKKEKEGAGDIVFAMGDPEANACYVGGGKIDDYSTGLFVPADTIPLGVLIEGGGIYCSSCHVFPNTTEGDQTVFLFGGDKDDPAGPGGNGIIMASTDGQNWTTAHTIPHLDDDFHSSDVWVFAIVWGGDGFYAGAHKWVMTFAERDDGFSYLKEIKEFDILLRSSNGMSWSEAGSQEFATYTSADGYVAGINHGDPPWGETGGLLAPYCPGPLQCANGSNAPDGFSHYSYDTVSKREIFIRPDGAPYANYAYGDISINSPASAVLIDINEGGNQVIAGKSSSPGIPIYALAYSGGAIIVVGGTHVSDFPYRGSVEFSISYDMGDTWIVGSYSGRPPATTVCGKHKTS